MNVKQLKEELNKYPDTMDVFVAERKTEFAYGLVNSVKSEIISFDDEFSELKGEELPREKVVVIDEE